MAFATRTLRDTPVNAAGAGGFVTILVDIEDDTTANNAILDASALDGHANGAKLHLNRIWWSLVEGTADDDTGHVEIIEVGAAANNSQDSTQFRCAGTGHYDGTAGAIKSAATNTAATSGDHEASCFGTSGTIIIEFKKDENYTS
jgi:hypothetical protein